MIRRNDIEGAVQAMRDGVADRTWTPDVAKLYLKSQDDPTSLSMRWKQLADSDPAIGSYIDALARNPFPAPEPPVPIVSSRRSDSTSHASNSGLDDDDDLTADELAEIQALLEEFGDGDGSPD